MIALVILFLVWYLYRPSIDFTTKGDTLLWFNHLTLKTLFKPTKRKYFMLYRNI